MRNDNSRKNSDTGQLDVFRRKLKENGIKPIVTTENDVTETLQNIVARPTVASAERSDIRLPSHVDTDPTFAAAKEAETGITSALLAIASHGSVVVSSTLNMDGPVSLWPPHHIAILRRDDIVPDVGDALDSLADHYQDGINDTVIVSGPSVTGDMGGRVTGVHGPVEMEVLIIV